MKRHEVSETKADEAMERWESIKCSQVIVQASQHGRFLRAKQATLDMHCRTLFLLAKVHTRLYSLNYYDIRLVMLQIHACHIRSVNLQQQCVDAGHVQLASWQAG